MTDSKIEWTEKTWNPVRGCALVSAGCANCYAMKQAHRFSGPGKAYEGLTELGPKGPRWNGTARFVPERLGDPLRWRKPQRVFVNSMSDLFHEDISDGEIDLVFATMAQAHWHTFQVLTKRPQRMHKYLTKRDTHLAMTRCFQNFTEYSSPVGPWPLPNVLLGVSIEDQETANERLIYLRDTPAALRFMSYEPALGPWDPIRTYCPDGHMNINALDFLDWVIIGGESGHGARVFDLSWARTVVTRCKSAGVACFVKQLGAVPHETRQAGSGAGYGQDFELMQMIEKGKRLNRWRPDDQGGRGWTHITSPDETYWKWPMGKLRDKKGGDWSEWPEDLRVREYPMADPGSAMTGEMNQRERLCYLEGCADGLDGAIEALEAGKTADEIKTMRGALNQDLKRHGKELEDGQHANYGKEMILDIHGCNVAKFNRKDITAFFEELCERIDMEAADLHFWDDVDTPPGEEQTEPHLVGTSAIQFIMTSNITIHTLDLLKRVYLNIFSCKDFDTGTVHSFCLEFFGGKVVNGRVVDRI